jgi:hypothetical protein
VGALSTIPSSAIETPATDPQATLPLHILAHVGQPGAQVIARLRWQDGTDLLRMFSILHGADGQGLLLGTLNWMGEGPPPQPPTQPATLEILSASGELQDCAAARKQSRQFVHPHGTCDGGLKRQLGVFDLYHRDRRALYDTQHTPRQDAIPVQLIERHVG